MLAGAGFGPAARAQSASTWNKRGQTAELREDFDSAYEDYLAQQVPVLWMPQPVYQISEISNQLHGTSPQSPIEGLTPENWYLTK